MPQVLGEDRRGADLVVPHPVELLPDGLLDLVDDHHALRQEEREPGAVIVEVEQVEVTADAAVVALAGLLEPLEVRVELGPGREGGRVDPGEHRVLLAAPPVRPRDGEELDRADPPGVAQVRAAAEVHELALPVDRHLGLALPLELVDLIDLVRLLPLGEVRPGVGHRHDRSLERRLRLHDAVDLGFDGREVGLRQRPREVEVVVEAVLDRRAEAELRLRDDRRDRLRQDVSGGVAHDVEVVVPALRGDDLDGVAVGQRRARGRGSLPDLDGDRGLGQAGADRRGGVVAGRPLGQVEAAPVGQEDVHGARG